MGADDISVCVLLLKLPDTTKSSVWTRLVPKLRGTHVTSIWRQRYFGSKSDWEIRKSSFGCVLLSVSCLPFHLCCLVFGLFFSKGHLGCAQYCPQYLTITLVSVITLTCFRHIIHMSETRPLVPAVVQNSRETRRGTLVK